MPHQLLNHTAPRTTENNTICYLILVVWRLNNTGQKHWSIHWLNSTIWNMKLKIDALSYKPTPGFAIIPILHIFGSTTSTSPALPLTEEGTLLKLSVFVHHQHSFSSSFVAEWGTREQIRCKLSSETGFCTEVILFFFLHNNPKEGSRADPFKAP